ncbi:MAG: glycosyltransferase family 2 protein [Alphaproteobacteria bacterium]|nr:glycosyltransferase family 2 protein [Alphaproteobacteria bacterium]
MAPKVSVIVPVYNTEKYLTKCLESLTRQTLSDIEIICINDASTDGSLQILQEYALRDDRIKVIDLKENGGVSHARNVGIDKTQGEYLGFVDSDDFIDLDFYEKLYHKAVETEADVVKGNVYDYDIASQASKLTDFYDINDKIRENEAYFLYGFTSAVYKTDLIKNNKICFPTDISYFEDPYFSISVTLLKPKIGFVDDAKYFYIRHDGSAATNYRNIEQVDAFYQSVCLILDRVHQYELSESEYHIYTSFLLEHTMPRCHDVTLTDEATIKACACLEYLLTHAKFGIVNLLSAYFMLLKQEHKDTVQQNKEKLLKQLRAKLKGSQS